MLSPRSTLSTLYWGQVSAERTASKPMKKIIHIDMDCFYAAIEMRDDPTLAGHPLAVGGQPDKRGVVATCNYEARAFGIHSAMAMSQAVRRCPDLMILPPRMSYYRDISKQIRAIFQRYTDVIEPLSLDEAFLDVTDCNQCRGSATLIAEDIRSAIRNELQLTASAGIAPVKFLAKICSDENKPDGQFVITPSEVDQFTAALPLRKIPGVGKVSAQKLAKLGLNTCQDVRDFGEPLLVKQFGKFGRALYQRALGIDKRSVVTEWVRKSVSAERTLTVDYEDPSEGLELLAKITEEVAARYEPYKERGIRSLQVKLKFSDFSQTTMERKAERVDLELAKQLMVDAWARGDGKSVRLIGVGVSLRDPDPLKDQQLTLFEES